MTKRRRISGRSVSSKRVLGLKKVFYSLIATLLTATFFLFILVWFSLSNSEFNEYDHLNVLVITKTTPSSSLYLFDLIEDKLTRIDVPNHQRIPVAKGYGWYQLGVVDELSKQELGDLSLATMSISNWLGINMTQTLVIRNGTNAVTWRDILHAKSDMALFQRIWLARAFFELGKSQTDIDLEQNYLTAGNQDTQIQYLSETSRQRLVERTVSNPRISQSGIQVGVVNTTGITGLASFAIDRFRPLGYDIVNVRDQQETLEVTTIHVQHDLEFEPEFIRPVLEMLSGEVEIVTGEVLDTYRADVVIKLGSDYYDLVRSSFGR